MAVVDAVMSAGDTAESAASSSCDDEKDKEGPDADSSDDYAAAPSAVPPASSSSSGYSSSPPSAAAGSSSAAVPNARDELAAAFHVLNRQHLSPGTPTAGLRTFRSACRMHKRQLGCAPAYSEVDLLLILNRARALFNGLVKGEDRTEREMLLALFGGLLSSAWA